MFYRGQAGALKDGVVTQRLRKHFSPGRMQISIGTATATAPADAVGTMLRSAQALNRATQKSPPAWDAPDLEPSSDGLAFVTDASASGKTPHRPWSLTDAPLDKKGRIFGWRADGRGHNSYAAAGVVPFAYREDEGQLYVLMSVQKNDKSNNPPYIYTFLGGKVTKADERDARRTAAREAHEETHRLLDEQLVLEVLTGRASSYGGGGGGSPPRAASAAATSPATAAAESDTAAAANPSAANGSTSRGSEAGTEPPPTPPPPPLPSADASAASGSHSSGTSGPQPAGDNVSVDGDVDGKLTSGPYPVPCEYFDSGRYMAFAVHMPDAWNLPEECAAKIRAEEKHPEAKKVDGLEWVSMERLAQLRTGEVLRNPATGRDARGHHYVLSLLRASRPNLVGVFSWVEWLQRHLRAWHGRPAAGEVGADAGWLHDRERVHGAQLKETTAAREAKAKAKEERRAAAAAATAAASTFSPSSLLATVAPPPVQEDARAAAGDSGNHPPPPAATPTPTPAAAAASSPGPGSPSTSSGGAEAPEASHADAGTAGPSDAGTAPRLLPRPQPQQSRPTLGDRVAAPEPLYRPYTFWGMDGKPEHRRSGAKPPPTTLKRNQSVAPSLPSAYAAAASGSSWRSDAAGASGGSRTAAAPASASSTAEARAEASYPDEAALKRGGEAVSEIQTLKQQLEQLQLQQQQIMQRLHQLELEDQAGGAALPQQQPATTSAGAAAAAAGDPTAPTASADAAGEAGQRPGADAVRPGAGAPARGYIASIDQYAPRDNADSTPGAVRYRQWHMDGSVDLKTLTGSKRLPVSVVADRPPPQ